VVDTDNDEDTTDVDKPLDGGSRKKRRRRHRQTKNNNKGTPALIL